MKVSSLQVLLLACVLTVAVACEKVDRSTSDSETPSHSATEPQIVTTDSGIEMVLIAAGSFMMGSEQGDADQQPVHEVQLDAFLMDRYEVTQAVYTQCDPINGSHFKGPDLPAEMVGWGKAALYCNLRSEAEGLEPCYNDFGECNFEASGYRLPTEAEWEYACRAGTSTAYSFGADQAKLAQHAWFKSNAGKKTHAVGKKEPNAWGLYDMHGNVAEWCNDFYAADYYQQSAIKNPRGPSEGEKNVLRGGHWGTSPTACQSAHRVSEEPGFSDACFARDAIGFRCVRKPSNEMVSGMARSTSPQIAWGKRSLLPNPLGLTAPFATPTPLIGLLLARSPVQNATPATATPDDTAKVGFAYSSLFLEHDTGQGHPERKERLTAILNQLRQSKLLDTMTPIAPRAASERWLTSVHTVQHVKTIQQLCEKPGSFAGSRDTPVSRQSFQAAVHAAGAGLAAVDAVIAGTVRNAFCAIRPPGHHATRDRAMGFCLLNNAAITARYIQQQHRLQRILIVDWDVHHGNGTAAIFEDDPSVFYFSVHQYPFYPGTGSGEERGAGEGIGTTLNVPLPAGTGDAEFQNAIDEHLVKAAADFKPDFVLISAGFDAHEDDPLGGMKVTTNGFAHMTRTVKRIADTHCQGRLVSLLEGGYDLQGLAASVEAHLRVLGE